MKVTVTKTKFIHEGQYAAEVDVELIKDDSDWSPYLSPEDAFKFDNIREDLREGNLKSAAKNARIYELHPVG
jgi:hypothetical protein